MFGLPEKTLNILSDYFASQPEIDEVRIYGSRAMGKEEPGSDIDIAIWSSVSKDLSGHIKTDLEDLPTPYMFDVTDYKYINHLPLKEHIDRMGKVLYKKG